MLRPLVYRTFSTKGAAAALGPTARVNAPTGKRVPVISIAGWSPSTPGKSTPTANSGMAKKIITPLANRRKRELSEDDGDPTSSEAKVRLKRPSFRQALFNPSQLVAGLTLRLIKMRVVRNMTKNGKYQRFSAMVAAGNGQGGLGIAHAKAIAAVDAIAKAGRTAARTMQFFERWQNRTLFHDDQVKFKATKLILRPAPPNTGRRCHPAISEMCRCMGISDISCKVIGSTNPINVAQAFLLALKRQKSPEQVASESGLRIVDVLRVYQEGCAELTQTLRRERYSTLGIKQALQRAAAPASPRHEFH